MIKIRIYPTKDQQIILNEWLNVARYTYNKALAKAKEIKSYNFQTLRNLLVTHKHKDGSINQLKEFELNVPKDIRAGSIRMLEANFTSARTNYIYGNISKFKLNFRKKKSPSQYMRVTKSLISKGCIENGIINIGKKFTNDSLKLKIGKRNNKKYNNMSISNDILLIKQKGRYFINIPKEYKEEEFKEVKKVCGIDPGIRTFLTTFDDEEGISEYSFDREKLKKLNTKIDLLNELKKIKKGKLKRKLNKYEIKKENYINEIHWKSINQLLNKYDMICLGDIKSHNIVKGKSNKTLNRNINDIKFFQFKQRFAYKARTQGKLLLMTNEAYTTKTCCKCGQMNDPKSSEIYHCSNCNVKRGRDINASKNILMRGIMSFLD